MQEANLGREDGRTTVERTMRAGDGRADDMFCLLRPRRQRVSPFSGRVGSGHLGSSIVRIIMLTANNDDTNMLHSLAALHGGALDTVLIWRAIR